MGVLFVPGACIHSSVSLLEQDCRRLQSTAPFRIRQLLACGPSALECYLLGLPTNHILATRSEDLGAGRGAWQSFPDSRVGARKQALVSAPELALQPRRVLFRRDCREGVGFSPQPEPSSAAVRRTRKSCHNGPEHALLTTPADPSPGIFRARVLARLGSGDRTGAKLEVTNERTAAVWNSRERALRFF